MSLERFKNKIKDMGKKELVDEYKKINSILFKYMGYKNGENTIGGLESKNAKGKTITGHAVLCQKIKPLKKQRAIVLTRLNQLGWNGRDLE